MSMPLARRLARSTWVAEHRAVGAGEGEDTLFGRWVYFVLARRPRLYNISCLYETKGDTRIAQQRLPLSGCPLSHAREMKHLKHAMQPCRYATAGGAQVEERWL